MKKLLLLLTSLFVVGDVMAQCSANFIAAFIPRNNDVLNYDFSHVSTTGAAFPGKIVSATINYGDGNFGSFTTGFSYLRHNYAAPGTYNVALYLQVYDSITSSIVCADTMVQTITAAYRPCASIVSSTKVNDSTYNFTAVSASSNPAAVFSWHYGDGTSGTGASTTHTFPRSGSYWVYCYDTVPGCGYVNGFNLNVNFLGPFDCDSVQPYIYAGVAARTVTMTHGTNSSFSYPGKVVNFSFDYGDGSAVTASATHAYTATGTYTIKGYVVTSDSATSAVLCRDTLVATAGILSLYSDLYGNLFYDSVTYGPGNVKIWLISHDTAAGTLTAIDSSTSPSNGYRSYYFQSVPPGRYLVKAAWTSVGSVTGLVPTYSDSSLLWSGARTYLHNGVANTLNAKIYMRAGTATSGPGFVGGSVTLGANKGTASGAPGVSMILYDAASKMVAMTETDAQGNYSFSNVPVGTYVVLPELLSYDAASSMPFGISASSPTIKGISFIKDDTKMSIRAGSLGIEKYALSLLSVSPNPARNDVRIVADGKSGTDLELRDLSGKIVHRASVAPGAVLNLDVRSFPAGLYFLHAGSGAPVKLVIE